MSSHFETDMMQLDDTALASVKSFTVNTTSLILLAI